MATQVRPTLNDELLRRLHKSSHLPALDAVRGLAACMVVCAHILGPVKLGNMGVLIFFVLSGFLITWLLLRELEQTQSTSIKGFYARRTLRIFPAFYVFWFICVLATALRHAPVRWAEAMCAFFYVGDYYTALHFSHVHQIMAITWSLGVEEKFYLIWPAVFVFWSRDIPKLFRIVAGAIAVLWLYRVLACLFLPLPPDYLKYSFDSRFADILVGCGLALALKLGHVEKLLRSADRFRSIPIALAITIGVVVVAEGHLSSRWFYLFLLPFSSLAIATLLLQLVFLGSLRGYAWFEHPLLRFFGRISYSLYLYHMLAIASVEHYLPHLRLRWAYPLMVVLSIGLACLSYYCVEKPFLQMRRLFESSRPRHRQPVSLVAAAASGFEAASLKNMGELPENKRRSG
jgi:peptidoglycan/LPS O-acetylase OafA/YrhL